jgi:hypothetical protein
VCKHWKLEQMSGPDKYWKMERDWNANWAIPGVLVAPSTNHFDLLQGGGLHSLVSTATEFQIGSERNPLTVNVIGPNRTVDMRFLFD